MFDSVRDFRVSNRIDSKEIHQLIRPVKRPSRKNLQKRPGKMKTPEGIPKSMSILESCRCPFI